ncbi:MAG: hypothetical protein KDA60_09910, partial [Planctomycetales bacterium]|nr:hypothetical protein [Planctomycetales bacterium]
SAPSRIDNLTLRARLTHADTLTIVGTTQWTSGQLEGAGELVNTGTLLISGGPTRSIRDKTLTNNGTTTVNRSINLLNADIQNHGTLSLGNAALSTTGDRLLTEFANHGTLQTQSAHGEIAISFDNQNGTIAVSDPSKGSNSPSSLRFSGDTRLRSGTVISVLNGSDVFFQGTGEHTFENVAFMGSGDVHLNDAIDVFGTITSSLIGATSDSTSPVGLLIANDLTGSGSVINSGRATWSGGTTRRIAVEGGVTNTAQDMDPSDDEPHGPDVFNLRGGILATTFTNRGQLVHTQTSLNLDATGQFHNESTGTYDLMASIHGAGTFRNQGLVRTTKNIISTISAPFELNGGVVTTLGGEIQFTGSGRSSGGGHFITAPNTKVTFNAGHPLFSSGIYQVAGFGTLELSSGVDFTVGSAAQWNVHLTEGDGWVLDGAMQIDGLAMNSAETHWKGKTLSTSGSGRFENSGNLFIDTGNSHRLRGGFLDGTSDLTNTGTVRQHRTLHLDNAEINNMGQWLIAGGDMTSTGESLVSVSSGRLQIEGGERTRIDAQLINDAFGIIDVRGGRTLELRGGGEFYGTSQILLGEAARLVLASSGTQTVYRVPQGSPVVQGFETPTSVPVMVIEQDVRLEIEPGASFESRRTTVDLDGGEIVGGGTYVNGDSFFAHSGRIDCSFLNQEALFLLPEGNLRLSGSLSNSGVIEQFGSVLFDGLQVVNEGVWSVSQPANIQSTAQASSFTNRGSFIFAPPNGGLVIIDVPFDNQGTVSAGNASTVRFDAEVIQVDSSTKTINGGSWDVSAPGSRIEFSVSQLLKTSSGTEVIGGTQGIPALASLVENDGSLICQNGCGFESSLLNRGSLMNAGNDSLGRVIAPNGITNEGKASSHVDRLFGEFAKQGSGIGHGAGQIGSGSLLSGFHVDNSAFVNAGEVVPGDAAGAGYFAVQGDFTQVSAGSLWIELGGDVAGQQFDQLFVTGNASLAGSLAVSLLDEYVPQVGDFFVVAAYGSHEGKFSQMSLPPLTEADAFWDVQYGDHSVTLSVHTRRADFNDDEHIDARDIDILTDQFGSADLSFDLNGDNVVDQLDVDHLVHDILSTEYGDADLDLDVDEVDLSIWQSNTFRDLSGWSNADFNGDGLADVSDFNLWFANRGFTLVEGPEAVPAQAVPEPGGYSWIPGLCWVAFLYRRAARTDIYAE